MSFGPNYVAPVAPAPSDDPRPASTMPPGNAPSPLYDPHHVFLRLPDGKVESSVRLPGTTPGIDQPAFPSINAQNISGSVAGVRGLGGL